MATVHVEVESKYDADPQFEVPDLVELFGAARGRDGVPAADGVPWSQGEEPEMQLGATYFDTADLDLASAGLTLRRRTGGEDAGWHLKVPTGGARSEVRVPLDDREDVVPDELRTMTYAVARGRPLEPVARIDTRRTVRRLVDPTGRVLVEVADDRVTARRLRPAGGTDPTPSGTDPAADGTTTWREVEVEVVDGPPALLAAADPVLRERGLVPSATGSKLARTLGVDVRAASGRTGAPAGAGTDAAPLTRSASAADVVLARLRTQVEQIRTQDIPVRLDAPGSVHAMRVATRRLRSALTTFGPLLDRRPARSVSRELRWLAGVLGAARDAEVTGERIGGAVDTQDDAVRLAGPADAEVREELDRAYRAAHDALLEALAGERYRALLDALTDLLDHPPLTPVAAGPARKVLPALVASAYAEVRTAMVAAHAAADDHDRLTLQHDARKAAKRARYAAEAVTPVIGEDAEAFATAMERLQETLGEFLDSVNTRERLRALASGTTSPGVAFTYGRLHGLEEQRGERAGAQVDAAWRDAKSKRLRRWLA